MVSVLNGGFAQWAAEGRDVVAGVATRPPVALTDSGVQERLLASMREVRAAIGDASTALLDVRPEPFYTGEEKKDYVPKAGHIESAVNLPPGALVEGETFLVKEPEAIGEALEEYLAPVEEAEDAIVYCNSGKTSAFGYLVLRYAQGRHDFVNLSVYDGSMRQWTSKGGKAMQLESAASR
jgi:thiosulfate/3-mercaptopyruvate sulfurtransferase